MLPLALLDLTLAQSKLVQHIPRIRPTLLVKSFARTGHALAVQTNRVLYQGPPSVQYDAASRLPEINEGERRPSNALSSVKRVTVPSHPAALVRNLVAELIELPVADSRALDGPIYNEDDLQQIYADLLASPITSHDNTLAIEEPISEENAKLALQKVAQRLQLVGVSTGAEMSESTGFAQKLYALQGQKDIVGADGVSTREAILSNESNTVEEPLHRVILSRLEQVMQGVAESRSETGKHLPVLLLSLVEWGSLVQECVSSRDHLSAEKTLTLMHSLDVQVPESVYDCLLNHYASVGNVKGALAFILQFSNGEPTELQRDRLIKAHLMSGTPEYNIGTALQTIHDFESRGLNPPMKTYTRAIRQLFRAKTSVCRAQAWDLFAHMRYVAHPQPDEFLYASMINACAAGPTQSQIWAQPEKALDLWHELRSALGEGVLPSVYAYNAIILVCARSRKFSGEAFRLAREMLNAHRDAFGRPLLRPTRHTFFSLLMAAKTRGDLSRVRWILAEMLSTNVRGKGSEVMSRAPLVDEEIMMHVLNAYASYKPPFVRSATRVYDETDEQPSEEAVEGDAAEVEKGVADTKGSFSSVPPQTSGEVIAEATLLFERIVKDGTVGQRDEASQSITNFADVKLTTRLANAYLSVHYQHGSIGDAQMLFYGSSEANNGEESIFERLDLKRSLRSYVEALERSAYPRDHSEKLAVIEFAERLWVDTHRTIREDKAANPLVGLEARWIERAWAAMIRVMASTGNLDRAMDILRSFTITYHPKLVRSTPSSLLHASDAGRPLARTTAAQPLGVSTLPSSMLSTRVALFADRPLVRLSSPADDISTKSGLADSTPPLLSFSDLELLHHRLVCEGASRRKDIAYLKWVCSAYKGALKRRWESAVLTRKSSSTSEESVK